MHMHTMKEMREGKVERDFDKHNTLACILHTGCMEGLYSKLMEF